MAWVLLLGAIATDVLGTLALERSDGLRARAFAVLAVVSFLAGGFLFSLVLREVAVSVADAAFAAGGTAAVAVAGALVLGERVTAPKAAGMALVAVGVVLLSLSDTSA